MRLWLKAGGGIVLLLAARAPRALAINLDVNDHGKLAMHLSASQLVNSSCNLLTASSASIKSAASTIAHGLVSYYTGNVTNTPETLGILPGPYCKQLLEIALS